LATTSGGGGGCYIVTASSGSAEHWMVKLLSECRDRFLLKHVWGEYLMEQYYVYSPVVAELIKSNKTLQWFSFILLLPIAVMASGLIFWVHWLLLVLAFLCVLCVRRMR